MEIVEELRDVCEYYQEMMGDDGYECTCTLDDYAYIYAQDVDD